MVKTFDINIQEQISSANECKDWEIVGWETAGCARITCELSSDKKSIRIQVPTELCDDTCVYVLAKCKECTTCDPQRVKICACEDSKDCDDCSTCVEGLCVSICDDGDFCENGRCKECAEDLDCGPNQVCDKDGNCVCKEGYYENENGKCVLCEGGVDENGECQECTKDIHCEPNEECIDNKCVCKSGFIKDQRGNCIPKPECEIDDDCGDCEECSQDGNCRPKTCPEGYVCVGDDCLPECECNSGPCDSKSACVQLDSDICYCSECSGNCNNDGDCGPGCYCHPTKGCIPNPCAGSCEDGTDCGGGCGCNKDGNCVPCDSLPCDTDCADVLGCGCPDGTNCKDLGCPETNCNNSEDCGDDCTCIDGECVNCSNFPDGCPDEECIDKLTLTKIEDSCDLEGKLVKESKCNCPQITVFQKFGVFSQKTSGNTEGLSTQYEIDLRKFGTLDVNQVRAGDFPLLDDTSHPKVADNDMPLSGTLQVVSKIKVRKQERNNVNSNWRFVGGTEIRNEKTVTHTLSSTIANPIVRNNIDFTEEETPGKVFELISDTERYVTTKIEFILVHNTDIEFSNNCVYLDSGEIGRIEFDEDYIKNHTQPTPNSISIIGKLKSSSERDPFFRWSRTQVGDVHTEDTFFRKLYIKESSPNTYIDLLEDYNDGLYSDMNYYLNVDCNCDDDKSLDVVYCDMLTKLTESNYILEDCNKTLRLLDLPPSCDVNSSINPLVASVFDTLINTNSVTYFLRINGQLELAFVYGISFDPNNYYVATPTTGTLEDYFEAKRNNLITSIEIGNKIDNNFKIEKDEPITSIEFIHGHTGECTVLFQEDSKEPEVLVNYTCNSDGSRIFTFSNLDAGGIIGTRLNSPQLSTNVILNQNVVKLKGNSGSSININFAFSNGCELKNQSFTHPGCEENYKGEIIEDNINLQDNGGEQEQVLNYTTVGGSPDHNIKVIDPNGRTIFNDNKTTNIGTISINIKDGGTYTVEFEDDNGFTDTDTFNVNVAEQPIFNAVVDSEVICQGQSTDINISTSPNATVSYRLNGSTTSFVTNSNGNFQISNIVNTSTYEFFEIIENGNTWSLSETVDITLVSNAALNSFSVDRNMVCNGEGVTLTVNGTPGVDVTINGSITGTIPNNGILELDVTPTSDPDGSLPPVTYEVTSASLGLCPVQYNLNIVSVNTSPGAVITNTTSCEEQSPSSNRVVTFNVTQPNGQISGTPTFRDQDGLQITSYNDDNNGNYEIILDSNTTVTQVILDYDWNGCITTSMVNVVSSCNCPVITVNSTVIGVCQSDTITQNIQLRVNSIIIEGNVLNSDFVINWTLPDNSTRQTIPNGTLLYEVPFGTPPEVLNFRYTIDVTDGSYTGCTTNGNLQAEILPVNDYVLTLSSNEITPTGTVDVTITPDVDIQSLAYNYRINGGAWINTFSGVQPRTYTFDANNLITPLQIGDTVEFRFIVNQINGCQSEVISSVVNTVAECVGGNVDLLDGYGNLSVIDGTIESYTVNCNGAIPFGITFNTGDNTFFGDSTCVSSSGLTSPTNATKYIGYRLPDFIELQIEVENIFEYNLDFMWTANGFGTNVTTMVVNFAGNIVETTSKPVSGQTDVWKQESLTFDPNVNGVVVIRIERPTNSLQNDGSLSGFEGVTFLDNIVITKVCK